MKHSDILKNALLMGAITFAGSSQAQDRETGMFAPLPSSTVGPMVDQAKGFLVEDLGDGLYWLTEGIYQVMFLTTGEGVIVVDAPPSIGQNIINAIASVTDEPITHVIYSHSHNDHIGGAGIFPAGVTIIAQDLTTEHLKNKNDPNRPIPTQSFAESMTLKVGSQTLQLDNRGVNHSAGNIFIYAPAQKTLMLVDVIFPGWTPFPELALAQSVDGFLEAHNQILAYDFDHFIGGHINRMGTRQDIETQQEYFGDIVQAAGKANGAMDFGAAFGEAAERGGQNNTWAFVKILFDAVTQQCADEVEAKWIDRLGAVDVFTFDHCWTISEHQRID